ncbi:MAG: hypothetical protein ACRD3J_14995 [Thermoanaerobaculia bacterium]
MRRLSLVLFLVVAFCAVPLSADALRVTVPAAGAMLHGGSFATLQWTASTLPQHAEEWEAFLSLDGGTYYAFRITPHLDIDRRQFDFVVPNVDTANARILIRTGDEKRESLFELPQRFSIKRDANAHASALHAVVNTGHAEAAREGDPVVIAWADGDRAGSRVTQESSTARETAFDSVEKQKSTTSPAVAPRTLLASIPIEVSISRAPASRPFAQFVAQLPSEDLLLVCRRRNI